MKRILSLILAFVMLASFGSIVNAEETTPAIPEKVEISFKVGDSTLMINGNAVTVETPYVVGAGTTLVPLRVITEAFGARVTWVDATKEIILEYPDVNITLQIGNINATVNDHTETLPEAPVLSPNGVTMVPLRFISETFGATVGYDNETAAITVVKETAGADDTISSSTDLPRIGDSYWGWSMMTPSSMMMTDRYSDGTSTTFEDEECVLYVDIYDYSDTETYGEDHKAVFDENYRYVKDYYFYDLTLSKDEKTVDENGNGSFRLTGRNKEEYWDYYSILKDGMCFEICIICPVGNEQITTLTAVVNSFKTEFAADDAEKASTHDLSTVDEEGYRIVEDDELKISFRIPVECSDQEVSQLNRIMYVADDDEVRATVSVGVYSKEEGITSQMRATEERDYLTRYINNEKVTLSEVSEIDFAGESAWHYTMTTNDFKGGNYTGYAIFFTKGEYNYNVSVTNYAEGKEIFTAFAESFTAEELDPEVTGVFLDDTKKETEEVKSSTDYWSVTLPSGWMEYYASGSFGVYMSNTAAILSVSAYEDEDVFGFSDVRDYATKQIKVSTEPEGTEVIERLSTTEINNRKYYTYTTLYGGDPESDDYDKTPYIYTTYYYTYLDGRVYTFELVETELIRGGAVKADVESIMASLELID